MKPKAKIHICRAYTLICKPQLNNYPWSSQKVAQVSQN